MLALLGIWPGETTAGSDTVLRSCLLHLASCCACAGALRLRQGLPQRGIAPCNQFLPRKFGRPSVACLMYRG